MTPLRGGSLFSGVEGLGLGLAAATGAQTAWVCERDKYASVVLAERFPEAPNHGDITAVRWEDVEPVDVIHGGFPCQPISSAGKKRGQDDDRWMWPEFARAVRILRPRLVFMENVSALLFPYRDIGGRWRAAPVEEVVGDLAEVGYDTRWTCLRASEVGAPHRRERFFLVAEDTERLGDRRQVIGSEDQWADADGPAGWIGRSVAGLAADPEDLGPVRPGSARRWGYGPTDDGDALTHTNVAPSRTGHSQHGDGSAAAGRRTASEPRGRGGLASDTRRSGRPEAAGGAPRREEPLRLQRAHGDHVPDGDDALGGSYRPGGEPSAADARGERLDGRAALEGTGRDQAEWSETGGHVGDGATPRPTPADTSGQRWEGSGPRPGRRDVSTGGDAPTPTDPEGDEGGDLNRDGVPAWGAYEPAIERWEAVHGPAPAPVDERGRLNPPFVEWMMGFPPGWVTEVPISRSAQLRCLGNAVVPHAAEAAWRMLYAPEAARAALEAS